MRRLKPQKGEGSMISCMLANSWKARSYEICNCEYPATTAPQCAHNTVGDWKRICDFKKLHAQGRRHRQSRTETQGRDNYYHL